MINQLNYPEDIMSMLDKSKTLAFEVNNPTGVNPLLMMSSLMTLECTKFSPTLAFLKSVGINTTKVIEVLDQYIETLKNAYVGGPQLYSITAVPVSTMSVKVLASTELLVIESGYSKISRLLVLFNLLKLSSLDPNLSSALSEINSGISEGDTKFDFEMFKIWKARLEESDSAPVAEKTLDFSAISDAITEKNLKSETNTETKDKKKKKELKTPALDKYSRNLSKLAEEGKLDPVVGRSTEVDRTVHILSRKKKNNPVLIGEPGVGKTAIAEGLAMRIASGEVPDNMLKKKLYSLDLVSLVAGTKFRGEFEERIKKIIDELTENPEFIIFIDELHTIVGAGNSAGQMDAANILKPALARGEIQCMGATTFNEYRESIESDGALERRFQKVKVEPTDKQETISILNNLTESYEEFHKVTYSNEAIEECVVLSTKYITDRHLPDKAIDLFDEVGAKVKLANQNPKDKLELKSLKERLSKFTAAKEAAIAEQDFQQADKTRKEETALEDLIEAKYKEMEDVANSQRPEVTSEDVATVISSMTGIPVSKLTTSELGKMKTLGDSLKATVIGQDDAVDKVTKAIKRNRLGLSDPNKPIGVFLFTGPTGVGKTQLAKKLAEEVFSSEDNLIRIDMSELTSRHEVSKLIGSAPGFIGYKEGGKLTEAVRKKPYSIVLLDEFEKAHKDVYNIFLQVFDDGRLTDGIGKTVDFTNTIIIMTSNTGSRAASAAGRGVGFAMDEDKALEERKASIVSKQLNKTFSPEFLNRLDGVVKFNHLTKENIASILDIELTTLKTKYKSQDYELAFDKKAKEFLIDKGFKREFGARPLKRALIEYVDDLMVDTVLDGDAIKDVKLTVTHRKGKDNLTVKVPKSV